VRGGGGFSYTVSGESDKRVAYLLLMTSWTTKLKVLGQIVVGFIIAADQLQTILRFLSCF